MLRRALGIAESPGAGAGVAIALTLTVLGLLTWKLNPYAALILALPLHALLLASLTPVRRLPGLVLVVLGAVPLVLVAGYYMAHFNLGPLDALWYAFLLVVGHQAGWLATAAAAVFVTLFLSTLILVVVREPEDAYGDGGRRSRGAPSEPRLPILGPGGHAGPGKSRERADVPVVQVKGPSPFLQPPRTVPRWSCKWTRLRSIASAAGCGPRRCRYLLRRLMERTVDTSELRRQIASGEYRLDARAIAEAMFARADRDMAPASLRSSKVLEARQGDGGACGVE